MAQYTVNFPNLGSKMAMKFLRKLGPAPWEVIAAGRQHAITENDAGKLDSLIKAHETQRQATYVAPPSHGAAYWHLAVKAPLGSRSTDFRVPPAIVIAQRELTFLWPLEQPLHVDQANKHSERLAKQVGGRSAVGVSMPLPGTSFWIITGQTIRRMPVESLRPLPITYRLVNGELEAPVYAAAEDDGFVAAHEHIPTNTPWIWPNVIPEGQLSIFMGPAKVGKSQIAVDAAARVSRGDGWPTGEDGDRKGAGVILMECEDAINDTIARLTAAGADLRKVIAANMPRDLSTADGLKLLDRQAARLKSVRLVVLSPIRMFFGESEKRIETDVRHKIEPIMEWASTHGVGLIGVGHVPDGAAADSVEDFAGPKAIVRRSRSVWAAQVDPNDPLAKSAPKKARRIFKPSGVNNGSDQDFLNYRIVGADLANGVKTSRVKWEND